MPNILSKMAVCVSRSPSDAGPSPKSNFAVSLFDESEASEAHSRCVGKVLTPSLQINHKKWGYKPEIFSKLSAPLHEGYTKEVWE
jgi:hypothetical protein